MKNKLQQIRRFSILTSVVILGAIGFQLLFTLIFGEGYTLGPEALIVLAVLLIAILAPLARRKKESVK